MSARRARRYQRCACYAPPPSPEPLAAAAANAAATRAADMLRRAALRRPRFCYARDARDMKAHAASAKILCSMFLRAHARDAMTRYRPRTAMISI